jgi:peptidoglycan/LPS O-acetylase OafA/YrhL
VLFFIISGYLITCVLQKTVGDAGYLRNFYIRRFFRIAPLMLVVLAVSAAIQPALLRQLPHNLLLVNNYAMAAGHEPMFRTDVMWSLAVEEHFYLVWPLAFLLLGGRVALACVAIIVLGLTFDARLWGPAGYIVPRTTHGCMQYIAMGCLLATGKNSWRYFVGAVGAFTAIWLATRGLNRVGEFRWVWWGVSCALFALTWVTIYKRPIFRNPFLALSGRLCYGLYLWHFLLSAWLLGRLGSQPVWTGAAFFACSYALAIVSFLFFEQPMNQRRAAFEVEPKLRAWLMAGIVFALICAAVALLRQVPVFAFPS